VQKRILRGVLVGAAAFLLVFVLHNLKVLRSLEWKSWDARVRFFSRPSQAGQDIVLVAIDQYSLDFFEKQQNLPWPWPREIYGALLHYLRTGGAKACFLDLILSETSTYGAEDDKKLAEAVKLSGNTFLPVFLSKEDKVIETGSAPDILLKRFSIDRRDFPTKALYPLSSVSLPVEDFLVAVRGIGNVQLAPDGDAIYRRLPLAFAYKDLVIPSLPLALADYVSGEKAIQTIPLDGSGQMILRYHGPSGTYKSYSIAALINSQAQIEEGKAPQVPPQEFAGKLVIVGTTAPGLFDLRPSPFSARYHGMEILATATDNILQMDFVRLPSFLIVYGLMLFFALLVGVGVSLLKRIWAILLFFLLALLLPAAAVTGAFHSGYWLDFVSPEVGVLTSFIGASLLKYSLEGKQRRFIKSVFRHYLSPHVIEEILEDPSRLRLGGEAREVSSFFSDVAGFTSISEGLSPENLVNLLNAYLSAMTDIILSLGGTLDKYEGDAIIAFWNAPLDQSDHALLACRAALRCQKKLRELSPEFKAHYGHEMTMRIGLNSGPAVIGNMGSSQRFDYTAMGDTINLAARLEGACKQYKVSILIGETTYEKVKDVIVAREVDLIRVVGKKKPVHVYEIIGEKGDIAVSEAEKVEVFSRGLALYRNREWEKAQTVFQQLRDDELAKILTARASNFIQIPPPADWDGVFDLKNK
jgi:adenylate cyclase